MGDDLSRQLYAAYRDPSLVVLEGFHPVAHALRFGGRLRLAVTYDRSKLLAIAGALAPDAIAPVEQVLREVGRDVFSNLCPRSLSSPLLAVATRPAPDVARALTADRRPVVFMETPRNPGNVGAVIRVAAAADLAAVVVSGHVDPWSPVVLRSATGLQFALPVGTGDLPEGVDRPVVVLDPDGEPFRPDVLAGDSVLVVGGERHGASATIRQRAERCIALPMRAGVSSLNLATAVSALLFSWRTSLAGRTGSPPW